MEQKNDIESVKVEEPVCPEIADLVIKEPTLISELKLDWSPEEKLVVERIKTLINDEINREFAKAFSIEKQMLDKVRMLGTDGTWMLNQDGSIYEDWNRITTQDMDNFVQDATVYILYSSETVSNSFTEAVFAKNVLGDAYDDYYAQIPAGTTKDKEARAKRSTRQDRWFANYKALKYRRGKEVIENLETHVRRIEAIRKNKLVESDRVVRATFMK